VVKTLATKAYCPNRGDLIWIDFNPQSGKEIMKRRPALVLTPKRYNQISGLCLVCPITSKPKGHGFEIVMTIDRKAGVIKSDQIKSFDWQMRKAAFIAKAPRTTLQAVLSNIQALLFEA
jgi:mRNA interferase MazF